MGESLNLHELLTSTLDGVSSQLRAAASLLANKNWMFVFCRCHDKSLFMPGIEFISLTCVPVHFADRCSCSFRWQMSLFISLTYVPVHFTDRCPCSFRWQMSLFISLTDIPVHNVMLTYLNVFHRFSKRQRSCLSVHTCVVLVGRLVGWSVGHHLLLRDFGPYWIIFVNGSSVINVAVIWWSFAVRDFGLYWRIL
jgi:hypothetical protein